MTTLSSAVKISILSVSKPLSNGCCMLSIGSHQGEIPLPEGSLVFSEVSFDEPLHITLFESSTEVGKLVVKLANLLNSPAKVHELALARVSPRYKEPFKVQLCIEPFENQPIQQEDHTDSLYKMLENSHQERSHVQNQLVEATQKFDKFCTEQSELIQHKVNEVNELQQTITTEKAKHQQTQRENTQLLMQKTGLEAKVVELQSKIEELEGIQAKESLSRTVLENTRKDNTKLREQYCASVSEFETNTKSQVQSLETSSNENSELRKKIHKLYQIIDDLKSNNDQRTQKIHELEAELAILRSKIGVYEAKADREKQLETQLAHTEGLLDSLQDTLKNFQSKANEKISELTAANSDIALSLKRTQDELQNVLEQYTETQLQHQQSDAHLNSLQAALLQLENDLVCQKDLQSQLAQAQSQANSLRSHRDQLMTEVKQLSGQLETQSKRIANNEATIKNLEQSLAQKQSKIDQLKETVKTLKKLPNLYIPDKNDPVDIALADYLNTVNPGLKLPIKREEPGVYNFGAKRVFVKLEQGKLVFRVGGGYMQIEDFIQIYSEAQVEMYENQLREQAQQVRRSLYGKYANKLCSEPKLDTRVSVERPEITAEYAPFYAIHKKPANRGTSPRYKKKKSKKKLGLV